MAMTLENKAAIITGSTRGFGRAMADAFAQAGAQVMISSRSAPAVQQTLIEMGAQGWDVAGQVCDVAQLEQVQALMKAALQAFGKVDVWVNNAGISPAYGPTVEQSAEDFRQVIETNILGMYYGSLVAMRYFLDRRQGKLINILGRGDTQPAPMQNAYGSSKTWLRSFTLALANENKDSGVGVFALNPGMMDTDLLTDVEVIEGYEDRLGETFHNVVQALSQPPEDSAQRAVWLASAATDGKTGLVEKELSPVKAMGRLMRHGVSKAFGRPGREVEMHVRPVPADWKSGEQKR